MSLYYFLTGTGKVRYPALILSVCLGLIFCVAINVQAAGKQTSPEFAFIGDMPYNAKQKKQFMNLMQEIDAANLGFVVHAGDYWFDGIAWKESTKGLPPCGDETMQDRLNMAKKSKHPFIITPGDNDWTDCYRAKPHAYDPLERLAKLRSMFFQGDKSLGQHKIKLTRQSENKKYSMYRENARWTYGNVLFVTLNMVGSNNNLGRSPEMDAEYKARNEANLAWMDEAFAIAKRDGLRAVMLIAQANPQFETRWTPKLKKRYLLGGLGIKPSKENRTTGFSDFLSALEEHVIDFGKPVVYAHGDTHTFRIDKPLVDSINHRMIENFTRVETFGFPDTHWIRVIIDPDDPNVFQFRQEIVNKNRVEH